MDYKHSQRYKNNKKTKIKTKGISRELLRKNLILIN
jgi:hypothetical protein